MKIRKLDRKIYWSITATLWVFAIIAIYQFILTLTSGLNALVILIRLTNTSPEFKFLLICLSLWVNIIIIRVIFDIVFKLHNTLKIEDRGVKKGEIRE